MVENVNEDITVSLEPVEPDPQLQIPEELPLLPLRDIVIYPYMIVPLFVSREKSIRAVDQALGEHRMILLACQKDLDKEEPKQDDLYKVGTVAVICVSEFTVNDVEFVPLNATLDAEVRAVPVMTTLEPTSAIRQVLAGFATAMSSRSRMPS